MYVVSLMSTKGGVGKSLISLLLAQYFTGFKFKVCYLDIDSTKQGHIFVSNRKNLGLDIPFTYEFLTDKDEIVDFIDNSADEGAFDIMIIDTPGHIMDMNTDVLSRSDLTLIPMMGSEADIQLAIRTQSKIKREERTIRRKINYAFVFTRIPPAIKSKHFLATLDEIRNSDNAPFIKQMLTDRQPFFHIQLGVLIAEMNIKLDVPENAQLISHSKATVLKAHNEALSFANEVLDLLEKNEGV